MRLAENDAGILQLAAASQWHALHARYQHEKPVLQALLSKGHTVFLPLTGPHIFGGGVPRACTYHYSPATCSFKAALTASCRF